ncbi:glycosyltransferase [Superficieibacter sp.]|uniref:glycosyltransferase family 8 protein n=1 Tax=Superficieibacter sp. TaxID=2303322 RepID=UPI0028B02436|nr:glycosyltransferase [Superficieibacter sp.]
MFGTHPILSQQTFSGASSDVFPARRLDVAYGVDKNFLFGACISITSLLENNKDVPFVFHIFSDYCDDAICSKLEELAVHYRTNISIYIIDNNCFDKFPYTIRYSYATYYRFLTCEYLQPHTDNLIYLDADIICKGSVEPLLNIDIGDNIVAAVIDVEMMQKRAVEVFNFEPDTYFNAGMLYINLKAWRQNNILQKIVATYSNEELAPKLMFPDQDALNLLVRGKVQFINSRFNTFYNFDDEPKLRKAGRYKEIIKEDTVFIHFVGVTKPWFSWAKDYPAVKYFTDIYKISPWRDQPLYEASTLKQYKKKSVHEKYLGRGFESFKTYLTYTWLKWKKRIS